MASKQDNPYFVLNRMCILGFFVLNRVRVTNPPQLTFSQMLVEYPLPLPKGNYFPFICVSQYISHYSTVCNVHIFTPCSKKYVMILKICLSSKHAIMILQTTHFMLMTKVNCLKSLVNNTLDHFFFHTTIKKETIKSSKLNFQASAGIYKRKIWYHELRWNAV